jgi:hypothetical protein
VLSSYIVGLTGVVTIAVAWLTVQFAWRRAFPEPRTDPDVLAGRTGCSGCADPSSCKQEKRCKDR